MDKKYAIFDMDGTLLDSMGYWRDLAKEYMASKGVAEIPEEVLEQIKTMTMTQSTALFIELFHLETSPQEMIDEMHRMMELHYQHDIGLKPGAKDYLQRLKAQGVRLCIASATAIHLVELCLTRLGVRDEFEFLLSCEAMGVGKDKPDIYLESAKRFGAQPYEIAVYEDALYAVQTAKAAGFYVVGVYDHSTAPYWETIQTLSHQTMMEF